MAIGAPSSSHHTAEYPVTSSVCGHTYAYTLASARTFAARRAVRIAEYEQRPCPPCQSAATQRAWETKQQQMADGGWTFSTHRRQFERFVDGRLEIERAD